MFDSPKEVDPPPSLQQLLYPVVEPTQGEQQPAPASTPDSNTPSSSSQQAQDVPRAATASGAAALQPHAAATAAAQAAAAAAPGPSRPLQLAQLAAPPGPADLARWQQQPGQQSPATPQPLAVPAAQPAATAAAPDAAATATAPAAAAAGGGAGRLPDSPEDPDMVKVSSRSRVSSVAGKIAHDVRDGRLPRIMVAGNHSISTAAKAIVQARRYLRDEGQDVGFTPIFRSTDHSRALLELALVLMPRERGTTADNLAALDNAGGHETRIANSSRHARAGSTAAQQLRTRGICVLCSVGQDALANAVMACAHAACFLEDTGQQMVVQPVHVVLHRGDQDLHAIKLVVTYL